MERQSGDGREEPDTGEGERDSDVEPGTQTESQFRENHFAGVEEGWRDRGRRWRRQFSRRAHPFHSVFLQLSPRTPPLFPVKRLSFHPPSYMWQIALVYRQGPTEATFPSWPLNKSIINC